MVMPGKMGNSASDSNLDRIKFIISELVPVTEIILFGSRATGKSHIMSDYDLLVIVDHTINLSERLVFQSKIRKKLAEENILSDVIVQSRSDLDLKKNLPGHIVRTAYLEGVKI